MKQRNELSPSYSSQLPFGQNTLLLGASALVLYGLSRRSKPGVVLAAAGGLLGLAASRTHSSDDTVKATFLVNSTAERAYKLWRDLENLPRFMAHLKSVRVLDQRYSEWTATGPMGQEIKWHAETTEDLKNEKIAWKSLPGSDVETSGSVEFRPDPQGRGTFVTAEVHYQGPARSVGRGIAALLGKHPEFVVREELRRFKALLEAGETPTTVGQTHGPRGIHGHAEQVLFRETSNQPQPQAAPKLAKSA